jgi:CheY-like chemotaxis protein
MLAAMLGSDIAFMGELMIWLLAAAVLGLLAGGLLWRRRAEAEREAQRRAEEAAEAQRLTAERAEAEREARRQAQLLAEQQRQAAQAQRRAAEQAEARRLAEQRAEQQRLAAAQAEAERERVAAAEREMRRQAERLAEQQRLAAELAERERIVAAEKAEEAEREAQRLAAERAAPPPRLAAKSAAQTLVLVADDSKVVRIKTGRLLAQHQYQVSYASDGLDAVQQLQANPPDLVITDVEMPGMDGFELTRHIRGNPQTAQLPVIMITAADDRHREQAEAAGVSVLLGKPYPEDALIAQIRLAMGQDEAETSPA